MALLFTYMKYSCSEFKKTNIFLIIPEDFFELFNIFVVFIQCHALLCYFVSYLNNFICKIKKFLDILMNLFDYHKNQKQLAQTSDQQLFLKLHSSQPKIDQNSYSYAHIPMRKDLPQWNTSSAVLRHSSSLYTIPKDRRFKDPKVNYYDFQKLNYPSTLSGRATSFGSPSKRSSIPQVFLNNKNSEGSGAPYYDIDDMTLRRNKSATMKAGKTFGIGWNYYKKVRTPHRATVHNPEQVEQNPGMKYNISQNAGENAQMSAIHSRLPMFTMLQAENKRFFPGPQSYQLNQKITSKSARKTNFGVGTKTDFTSSKQKGSTPAPVYKISGFCDKFKTLKIKNGLKDSNY